MNQRKPLQFVSNSIAMNISREMALDYGLVKPTPEEAAARDESARRWEEKKREAWELYDAARPALAAITDPLARKVLDLHSASRLEGPTCQGCDMEGYECEDPEWPCRTVQAVAEHYDIALPDGSCIWKRPE